MYQVEPRISVKHNKPYFVVTKNSKLVAFFLRKADAEEYVKFKGGENGEVQGSN